VKIIQVGIRSTVVAIASLVSTAIISEAAFAEGSVNPLRELKGELCEKHHILGTKDPKKSVDVYGRTLPGSDKQEYLAVSRDHILTLLTKKTAFEMNMRQHGDHTYRHALIMTLVPCVTFVPPEKQQDEPARPPHSSKPKINITQCKALAALPNVSPEERFSENAGALVIRRSLLRLFEAAERGGTKEFAVIVTENVLKGHSETPVYRPLVSQLDDDIALAEYLNAPSNHEPFAVVCTKPSYPNKKDELDSPSKPTIYAHVENVRPKPVVRKFNAIKPVTDFNIVWTPARTLAHGWQPDGKNVPVERYPNRCRPNSHTKCKLKVTPSVKFVLVKDSSQFVSGEEGASFGTTVPRDTNGAKTTNANDVKFEADAALGLRFQSSRKESRTFNGEKNSSVQISTVDKFAATPFVSIKQTNPKQIYITSAPGTTLETAQKTIAYAEMAAGVRFEFQGEYFRRENLKGADTFANLTTGQFLDGQRYTAPGWSLALSGEYIGDNYNLQSASRIAFEVSPPANIFFNAPGYRRPYALDSRTRRRPSSNTMAQDQVTWLDSLITGLHLKWDAQMALEYLDFSRRPRDFEALPEIDPATGILGIAYKDSFPEYGLVGTNLSIELSKRGFLGLKSDSADMSLKLQHIYRDSLGSKESSERWEATWKITDPIESKRSIELTYSDGEDYRSTQEDESLSIKVSAKY
tara:strand:- start:556 stop:2637 length:2082 start_codon:yes stop_codon:yes gene_type:complete